MNTRSLHTVTLIFIPLFLFGQSLDFLIEEAEILVKKTETKLEFPTSDSKLLFTYQPLNLKKDNNLNLLEIDLKKLEANQSKKDIGLVFKANANHNFRDAIDEETNTSIITSVRTELEWNILKSGFFDNRIKSKRFDNVVAGLKEEANSVQKELWRRQFKVDYNYVLNNELISLNKTFLSFENGYFDLLNKLYYQKLIKREKLIQVSNQIHVLEEQIQALEKENRLLKDSVSVAYLKVKKLPLLKVQLDSFSLKKQLRKTNYKEENIRLEHHPLNNINLSFYINQNYRYSETAQRFFPSAGIRFKAPLRFNNRKKIIKTKIKILKAQELDKSLGQLNSIITYISEYSEKLKDLQNQYQNWQVLEERIRILKVIKEEFKTQDTGILLLELLEEQFKVLEETLELKKQLYKVITRLFVLSEANTIETLFIPYEFKKTASFEKLLLKNSRDYTIDFQISFIKAKQLPKVEVLKDDLITQNKLKKALINYVLVDNTTQKTVEQFIKEELKRIKRKANESI